MFSPVAAANRSGGMTVAAALERPTAPMPIATPFSVLPGSQMAR